MQFAWHLRNRHLPTQVEGIPILNREDHVIAAMLGATVEAVQARSTPKVAPMVNTRAATITTTIMNTEHFARLLTWTSPAYPAGAYTYSHGIEAAVEDGAVRDAASLAPTSAPSCAMAPGASMARCVPPPWPPKMAPRSMRSPSSPSPGAAPRRRHWKAPPRAAPSPS
ncbi:MAG: urease accessory protein UreF [Rhodospirillales bacterium]|nr:urease accessory protein UreF [Rhodospirillales bacterium]